MTDPAATHDISLNQPRPGRWQAICSCGHYESCTYDSTLRADMAGAIHVRRKGGIPKPVARTGWIS